MIYRVEHRLECEQPDIIRMDQATSTFAATRGEDRWEGRGGKASGEEGRRGEGRGRGEERRR